MHVEKLGDERVPVAGFGHRFPTRDLCLAVELGERFQATPELCRRREEVGIFVLEERHALFPRRRQRERVSDSHRFEERIRHLHGADAPALRLDEHRPRGIEPRHRIEQCALEPLLRGLLLVGQPTEDRAAMTGNAFEIERLRARSGERRDEPALARAGEATDHDVTKTARDVDELGDDVPPVRAIADFMQHLDERAAALTASPAIHGRLPFARLLREC